MTTKQITRKIRDWSVIRDRAIDLRLREKAEFNHKKATGTFHLLPKLRVHSLMLIYKYESIEEYCDRKLLHYASELQIKLTK